MRPAPGAATSVDLPLGRSAILRACHVTFQYTVKVVCGRSTGEVVAPGVYLTAVNVHNPEDTKIRFSPKVAVALPGLKPGRVSNLHDVALGQALEVGCPGMRSLAAIKDRFLKGFGVPLRGITELAKALRFGAAVNEL